MRLHVGPLRVSCIQVTKWSSRVSCNWRNCGKSSFNPLYSIYILHTPLQMFLLILTRRIDMKIKTSKAAIISFILIILMNGLAVLLWGELRYRLLLGFSPLTPMSDQDRISPYNINTVSSRQVMRIEKNINLGMINWSNTKFSELTLHELHGWQKGEFQIWSGR